MLVEAIEGDHWDETAEALELVCDLHAVGMYLRADDVEAMDAEERAELRALLDDGGAATAAGEAA